MKLHASLHNTSRPPTPVYLNIRLWAQPFNRQSGGTSSHNTGPSSAFEGSYYVYAEVSTPNNPGVEFSMYRNFGEDIKSVSFQYHMYGSTMGTALLQGSGDGGATYTTLWSKSGDQSNAWYGADLDITLEGLILLEK